MPSEKTLALRAKHADIDMRLRSVQRVDRNEAGYFGELVAAGKGYHAANRKNRLKVEKIGMTRAQRQEVRRLRRIYLLTGKHPGNPRWYDEQQEQRAAIKAAMAEMAAEQKGDPDVIDMAEESSNA
jgi:hypothetical protein